ncbi:TnsA-like heteromeric transposase endonuclease subunit [Kitasatospora aureofaciens]|uniref:TnsA-like heteromeric transposase endonuclease subunit n=1 Tax=Kitasatospora aureofaciens TaxID=1894 RepID=UPI0037CB8510
MLLVQAREERVRGIWGWHLDERGQLTQSLADALAGVPLEERRPPTDPVAYHGRQGVITHWWSSTNRMSVVCGSLRRLRVAITLDFDPDVAQFSGEPLELRWQTGKARHRWRPDFFVRTATGARRVVVVRPNTSGPLWRERLSVLGDAARQAGWEVEQRPVPRGIRLANWEWVADYRQPVPVAEAQESALLAAFRRPQPLLDGIAAAGLPRLTGLDLAYRLVWQRRLGINWDLPLLPTALAWALPAGQAPAPAESGAAEGVIRRGRGDLPDRARVRAVSGRGPQPGPAQGVDLPAYPAAVWGDEPDPAWVGRLLGPGAVGGRVAREVSGRFEAGGVGLGDRVCWASARYRVIAFKGAQVTLLPVNGGGPPVDVWYREVAAAEDFAVLDDTDQEVERAGLPPLGVLLQAASKADREQALWWHRHMKEVDTGLRPGRLVPRPGFDPEATTLAQRYQAKSDELAAVDIHVRPGTLADMRRRWKAACENPLVLVLDRRKGRTRQPGGRTDPRVIALLHEAVADCAGDSGATIGSVYESVQQLLRRRYAKELADPQERKQLTLPPSTFYKRMRELGLSDQLRGTTRQRSSRASKPPGPYAPSFALRPGQLVQIDTTPLHVKAFGDDGEVVSAELTALVDVASRTAAAVMIVPAVTGEGGPGRRVGGRATKAFDLVLTLAQCFAPMPTRPGWSPLACAAASALPYTDLQLADPRFTEATAARPVIHPRTIVVDQGSPYLSDHFRAVCDFLGISVRLARKRQPSDKPLAERFFSTLADSFGQYLPGWTGRNLQVRGRGIERRPLLTINQLQAAAEEWVALDYQQRPHRGLRSPFTPAVVLSPNEMHAHLVAMSGYRPRPLSAEDARHLLVPAWVTITDRGFDIENRTYQNPQAQLLPLAGVPSGFADKGHRWQAYYDPYHPEIAWLYDHRGFGHWIPAQFVHSHLITNPWTQYMWENIAGQEADAGRATHQVAVALAVQERRSRIHKSASQDPRGKPTIPFQGLPLEGESDPYTPAPDTDFAEIDLDSITPYPSLPVAGRQPMLRSGAVSLQATAREAAVDPCAGLDEIDPDTIAPPPLDAPAGAGPHAEGRHRPQAAQDSSSAGGHLPPI